MKIKNYKLDQFERNLIKRKNQNIFKFTSNNVIFFQCVPDHFFLHLNSEIIKKEKSNNCIGKLEVPIRLNRLDFFLVYPFILKIISRYFIKRKWKKLYSAIGIKSFIEVNFFSLKYISKSLSLYFKINEIEKLQELKVDGIELGDLLIDTIIRFRPAKLPTVNVRSLDMIIFYYLTFQYLDFYEKISKQSFDKAFISQSTYIFHGVALRKLYKNIKTFSSGSLEALFKEIKEPNDTATPYSKNYKQIFNEKFGEKEIVKGLKKFSTRFDGNDDLGWFNSFGKHPYYSNTGNSKFNFKGVVFLHDFYDAAHYYGKTLFPDLYSWAKFTLDLILKNNLNIAIKPHPFQIGESKKICDILEKEYKSLTWLKHESNKDIFKSGIDFGITQHGTVITELAYHNIKPIYCGNHPTQNFNIGFKATSISQYKDYILNYQKLKFDKNLKSEIGKYYYMNHIFSKNDYLLKNADGIKLKNIHNRFYYQNEDLEQI